MDNITVDAGPEPTVVACGDRGRRSSAPTAPSARRPRSWRGGSARSTTRSCAGSQGAGAARLPPRRSAGVSVAIRSSRSLAAIAGRPAWLVGGAVRDRLLGRPTADYDVAVAGDARRAGPRARARAGRPRVRALGGVRRLAGRRPRPQLAGRPAAADRRVDRGRPGAARPHDQRDRRAARRRRPVVDPFGGRRGPARARGCGWSSRAGVRRRSAAGRCGWCGWPCELGFAVDAATGRGGAGERRRGWRGRAGAGVRRAQADRDRRPARWTGLALMDALGATDVVLPELSRAARRRAEPLPPPRRVRAHAAVLAETIELERDPEKWLRRARRRGGRGSWPSRWPTS